MPLSDLRPPRRQSTVEYLAEQLRTAVMTGQLPPGTQLGEADLAERFEVSRGPLREAMQRLVSEGILYAVVNRGVFVCELTLEDVADVYRTRSVIERGALEIVLEERREETYRALEGSVGVMSDAASRGDATAVSDADQEFHEVLVESSGSPRLIRAMRTLLVETRMCLGELETTYPDLGAQVREHEELREAIRSEPPARAEGLLLAHLDDAVERLVAKRSEPTD
ncbi:transcriptional regulator, GntR family [Georgenia satyanarayanai]|uniref:Transcriptional regulator, GntR family n=1 Tax=Georgenia satyanarayanai TaxID=860221 RepID=A0A2Y8ZY49_9MICO|nr:GntR family transcriptional regulator [Georgenia satyanarayanai]PYG02185.1 GntR family transcriptional regulator [Georgenia satyanarayanai]SSA37014.1 transcriptional regulator, GntR family [Georgenia satyanarayanai]